MDISQILLMVVSGLIGLVWNSLKGEIARLDLDSRQRVERVELEAKSRSTRNETKIDQIEKEQANVVRAVGDLKAFIESKLGQFKLELAKDHVTKDDLRDSVTGTSTRLEALERDIRDMLANYTHEHTPRRSQASRQRNHRGAESSGE
jgi:hypothetical protein